MYGQAAEPQVLEPQHFLKVGSNWIYYDSIMIGPGWSEKSKGWFENFTDMAKKDRLTFLNVRSGSKDGYAYTNMDSTDQIGRPFRCESIGIRFIYPSPTMADEHQTTYAATKYFQTALTEHCYCEFWIRDDQWCLLNPDMMPDGFGYTGDLVQNTIEPSASDLITPGVPHTDNRFHYLDDGIRIPETAQVKLELTFSEYAKELLQEMGEVLPLDGKEGEFPNAAKIKVTLRGLRYVQMKGQYYK